MKRITFILISLFAFVGCSRECKDTNVIITTKGISYSKITGNLLDTIRDEYKWHVRNDSVFMCLDIRDEYESDTKLINDTLVTDGGLCIIHWE